ncbi:MAG: 2-C-methyl-D-erythritol 4-phosphate cytidylyltransferase [Actinobacteria bacterium]|jgi:2-C-methyl-D-erythritol 4-phosphate cytidylyltransferase|nr:MAG: 2-C-methyl-D-erythritol 4-phosphate cytidylyltransferase [Actinomycetota bacterium]
MCAKAAAIVAGAGRGERLGNKEGKQFLELAGVPLLARSLLNVAAVPEVEEIVLVVNAEDITRASEDILGAYGIEKVTGVVEGGEWRQESVFKALRALSPAVDIVVIHDGARPLATPDLFRRTIKALLDSDCEGIIAAIPVVDTIKEVEGGRVTRTPDRKRFWAVQTPQCFRAAALLDSHERAFREGVWVTDDAALLERCRYRVRVVEGELTNLKITYSDDLILAEALLAKGGLEVAEPHRPGL